MSVPDTLQIAELNDTAYDPFEKEVFGDMLDPHGFLRTLAERAGPVQEGEIRTLTGLSADLTLHDKPCFLVMGYKEIREVLSDSGSYSNDHFKTGLFDTFGNVLATMNPPEHTRYRRILQRVLLPHVVASWSDEFVEPVINQLIDKFAAMGGCDLVPSFVRPYPFDVVYRQLGLPPESARTFRRLSHAVTLFQADPAVSKEAGEKLREFFQALIDQRRRTPGRDLVSVLATTEVDGDRLPDHIVVSFFRQLLSAAGDTTFRATGSLLVGLLRDRPDQLAAIRIDRTLVGNAIEEALRWDGPLIITVRTATRDVELAGVRIPAGAVVQIALALANRDATLFPDPDRFDITRLNLNRHMAFAAGPHICVGQHLARLEMTRALNILLDRFPKLRLDPDHPAPAVRGSTLRRTDHIHIRFD